MAEVYQCLTITHKRGGSLRLCSRAHCSQCPLGGSTEAADGERGAGQAGAPLRREEQPDSVQSWWREEGCFMPPGFTGN